MAANTIPVANPSDACCDAYSQVDGSCVCGDAGCTTPTIGLGFWLLILVAVLVITGIAAAVVASRLRGKSRPLGPARQKTKQRKKKK